MNHNIKIIVNVTTSFNWHAEPVGIIRVEREIVKALINLYGKNVKLCLWKNNNFVQIRHDTYLNPKPISYSFKLLKKFYYFYKKLKCVLKNMLNCIFNRLFISLKNIIKISLFYKLKRITFFYNYFFNFYLRFKYPDDNLRIGKRLLSEKAFQINNQLFSKDSVFLSIGLEWAEDYVKHFNKIKVNGIRVVTMCYDLIPIKYPHYCFTDFSSQFSNFLIKINYGSNLVLSISKTTELELKKFYSDNGLPLPNIKTVFLGSNFKNDFDHLDEISIPGDYLLYVSTIEIRKNHQLLINVYKHAKINKRDMPYLVLVGTKGWGVNDLIDEIENSAFLNDKIIFLNKINDKKLKSLYLGSKFCLYPSFYEGFGLPVIEALCLGKFTLCSDIPSLKEIGKDYLNYIDPSSYINWYEEIITLLDNPITLKKYEKKILKENFEYSWENCVKNIIEGL